MNQKAIRIAITGPESTGKSWIASQLAIQYKTLFVEEYARTFINQLNRPYVEADILTIAQNQLANEDHLATLANRMLFCDTDLTVCKIWSEVKYNRCHPWIARKVNEHIYPLYLLMDIDLEWQEDPQREHPHMRQLLFDLYKQSLESRNVNFKVISGQGEKRLKLAMDSIKAFLSESTYCV
ncbi:MAG TPA: ATPase [Bacteroidales bacterium]|nr:MAG: ATPase [Bacteroidetes bacterium GWE2_42_24]OFY31350.1 MAG: ATPase [Bacteroidetes bacterium GWF2_43_11]PKP18803.1 MAG: ATPase [Bacteroidetes bacterium HGW-Bacteroidetes-22]HBZ67780.1 ATPase [Bacteroidales bacterium]